MCQPDPTIWRVVRLDDNGNRFEVTRGLSAEAADRLIRIFEGKKHKQTYLKEIQPCAKP